MIVAYISMPDDLSPGSIEHQMQVAHNYFRSKGVPTEQIYDDGIPRFRIFITLENEKDNS